MAKNTKTPVMILQELTVKKGYNPPNYELVYSKQGTHENTFHYSVCVQNQQATGIGKSKKEAKHDAATKVLELLAKEGIIPPEENKEIRTIQMEGVSVRTPETVIPKLMDLCAEHNIPAPTFNEISAVGLAHCMEFTYECKIASIKTKATAGSKKHAKQYAARDMLERIKDILPQIQAEVEQLQVLDTDEDVIEKYRSLTDPLKSNLNSQPSRSEYVLVDMMKERGINKDNLLKYFELEESDETLEKLLREFDAKFEMEIIQESPPVVVYNIFVDTPLSILEIGNDINDAKDKALKKAFKYLEAFIRIEV